MGVSLALENPLGGVDDGFAARKHAVDRVTGLVPKGKTNNLATAVVPPEGVVIRVLSCFAERSKQADFLRIEHPADECVALLRVFSELVCSDGAGGHNRRLLSKFLIECWRAQGRPNTDGWRVAPRSCLKRSA